MQRVYNKVGLYQNNRKQKVGEGEKEHLPPCLIELSYIVEATLWHGHMSTNETKSVAFDDDVNADRSKRMNIFSLHSVSQHK